MGLRFLCCSYPRLARPLLLLAAVFSAACSTSSATGVTSSGNDASGSGQNGSASGSVPESGSTGAATGSSSGAQSDSSTGGNNAPSAGASSDASEAGDSSLDATLDGASGTSEGGPVMSHGCGMALPANVKLGQWTDMADPGSDNPPPIMVNGVARGYWLRVPPNYDSSKPYKVIYEGAPCGQPTGGNGQPNPSGMGVFDYASVDKGDAVQVGVDYGFVSRNCYDDQNPQSNDFLFFPVLKKTIEGMLCIDTSSVFLSGYSSGSWWVNQMTCGFGTEIRATVEATGGEPPHQPTCVTGGHIASLFLHDVNDQLNSYAGILPACARALTNNGCTTTTCDPSSAQTTESWPVPGGLTIPGMGQCVQFKGCPADSPVVFCTTTNVDPSGANHYERVNAFIPPLFWGFLGKY